MARPRWTSKPPQGTQIDWSHPLAEGLVACYLLNEIAGAKCFDLVTPGQTIPFVGGAVRSSGRIQTLAQNAAVYGTANPLIKVNPPLSIVWQGIATAAQTNAVIFAVLYSNPDGTPFWCYGIGANATHSCINFSWNNAGSLLGLNDNGTDPVLSTSSTTQIAAVLRVEPASVLSPTNYQGRIFINGIPTRILSNVASFNTINYTATSTVGFGDITNFTASNIISDFGLIYNIGLSNGSLEWLAAEPYSLYEPPSLNPVTFLIPAAPPTDATATAAITESPDPQVAAATNAFGATISLAESLDVMVAAYPSAAYLQLIARHDSGVIAGDGGGYVFPATRHNGVCRWYPGLRPRIRQAKARI